jgi:hypothetical protein
MYGTNMSMGVKVFNDQCEMRSMHVHYVVYTEQSTFQNTRYAESCSQHFYHHRFSETWNGLQIILALAIPNHNTPAFCDKGAVVECVWNLMAHGDAQEEKWRGNWRMEWVASTLTLPRNMVYPALLTLMCTPRLPTFNWTDTPANLNGLVRFRERRNLVSARVITFQTQSTHQQCYGYFRSHKSENILWIIPIKFLTKDLILWYWYTTLCNIYNSPCG